jgi:hypothetical protein
MLYSKGKLRGMDRQNLELIICKEVFELFFYIFGTDVPLPTAKDGKNLSKFT